MPHVRVQDDAVVPLDLEVLAVALDRSIVRPARGVMPISRGASKRTIFWSTSAVRSAAAARWMVSPSGIAPRRYGAGAVARRMPADRRYRAARRRGRGRGGCRRSWPPVICSRTDVAHRLGRREPGQVERLLRRLAVAVDRHDVGQADGVVAGVVEPRAVGVGEVLDDRERRRVGRQPRQGQRAEVLLEVAQQRVAHPLAEQHPPADDHPADRAVGGDPQQQPDLGDPPEPVDAHRDGVDVDERHVAPGPARASRATASRRRSRSARRCHSWRRRRVSHAPARSVATAASRVRDTAAATPRRHEGVAMKQLTGLDGSFLYMETPTTFGHVNGLGIYERPSADFDPYDAVYRRFASKVGELEPMRRRVVEVPLHLDHPYWIDDPNFDLDFHIRHLSLAPPGRADQLGRAGRPHRRPADGPHPPAVGGLRHRGPGERALGAAHEVPPRHDRRRVGRADAER